MKNIFITIVSTLFSIISLISCQEDLDLSPEDTFLGTDVARFKVTQDYKVGAFYKFSNWNLDYDALPSTGVYTANDTKQYPDHIKQANKAGIDFFLFNLRTNKNAGLIGQDLDVLTRYQEALDVVSDQDSIIGYSFNFDYRGLAISNNNPLDKDTDIDVDPIILGPNEINFQRDFLAMAAIADANEDYYKLEGRPVVYISLAQNLVANDSPGVFDRMRQEVRDEYDGMELYIIGVQPQWQPPLRYDYRFVGAVDALTHTTYMRLNAISSYERINYFDKMTYGAWSYSQEALGRPEFDLEYIPTISPSANYTLTNQNSSNYIFEKNLDFFKSVCNSARGAVGESKLVLVDSFNEWNFGTQLEESVDENMDGTPAYRDSFLKVMKEEFKLAK